MNKNYMFLFVYLFVCCRYTLLGGLTSSFRVLYLWHIDAKCLSPAFCTLQQSQCTQGQPKRACRVQRSCSVVQEGQEDALGRDCKYPVPPLASSHSSIPAVPMQQGKVLLQRH